MGLTHITVGHDDQLKSRMYIRGSGTKSRWSHSGMSGSMKKRHTEERTLRTRRGVASRMSLRHLPTNAGQGRPAEHQRCCGRQPQHCLRCVRSHPMDGAPRLGSWRVRRLPAPTYRSFARILLSAGAGPPLGLLLFSITAAEATPTALGHRLIG